MYRAAVPLMHRRRLDYQEDSAPPLDKAPGDDRVQPARRERHAVLARLIRQPYVGLAGHRDDASRRAPPTNGGRRELRASPGASWQNKKA